MHRARRNGGLPGKDGWSEDGCSRTSAVSKVLRLASLSRFSLSTTRSCIQTESQAGSNLTHTQHAAWSYEMAIMIGDIDSGSGHLLLVHAVHVLQPFGPLAVEACIQLFKPGLDLHPQTWVTHARGGEDLKRATVGDGVNYASQGDVAYLARTLAVACTCPPRPS